MVSLTVLRVIFMSAYFAVLAEGVVGLFSWKKFSPFYKGGKNMNNNFIKNQQYNRHV
jgi:hypothetical protein